MNTHDTADPAGRTHGRWIWLATAAGLTGIYLLWISSLDLFGLDGGLVGSFCILLAGWSLAYALRSAPVSDRMEPGAVESWISLALVVVIGAYLFTRLSSIGWEIDLGTRAARQMATNVLVMIAGAQVLTRLMRPRDPSITLEDERDTNIRRKAAAMSHSILVAGIVGAIVTLALNPSGRLSALTPDVIAHALIGLLLISEATRHSAEIVYYRRDTA